MPTGYEKPAQSFLRLFFSVAIPEMVAVEIATIQKTFPRDFIRPVKEENLHLTLAFLGDTPEQRLPELYGLMDSVQQDIASWKLRSSFSEAEFRLTRLGTFPTPKKPKVLWCEVLDKAGLLERLSSVLVRELVNKGFPVDIKPFRPHVTIGYVKKRLSVFDLDQVTLFVRNLSMPTFPLFQVDDFQLISSRLAKGGSVFTVLAKRNTDTISFQE